MKIEFNLNSNSENQPNMYDENSNNFPLLNINKLSIFSENLNSIPFSNF